MLKNKDYKIYAKIPPQAVEMENAILGACMLESNAFEEIQDILTEESFYNENNQKIFYAIRELFLERKPIDMLTVIDKLKKNNTLDEIGGHYYIVELTSNVASSIHIEYHARIVQQKFVQRSLINICMEIQNKSYDESIDISELIDFAENRISNITSYNIKKMGLTIGEIGRRRLKILEEISKKEKNIMGVPCWEKLNRSYGGWQQKNLIIIAARPAMGKTRMAQEIAKISASNGYPVAFFSLEMADEEIYDRNLASETGFENMTIRKADFSDKDWDNIENAQRKIEKLPIIIDDSPALTIHDFKAKARLYKRKNGIKLIIIDYIQLMRYPEYKKYREQEVAEISKSLKLMAKELDIPIIALSQLSRKIEDRHDKTPMLSDLRESGAIEQDADVVAFIHRPEVYEKEPDENTKNMIQFIFAKHRHGTTGIMTLYRSEKWSIIYENKSQFEQYSINDLEF